MAEEGARAGDSSPNGHDDIVVVVVFWGGKIKGGG